MYFNYKIAYKESFDLSKCIYVTFEWIINEETIQILYRKLSVYIKTQEDISFTKICSVKISQPMW